MTSDPQKNRAANSEPFQYQLPTGDELALQGAQRAVDHADRVENDWSGRAYAMLVDYATGHQEFMTEDARKWASDAGLPPPPSARAWGAITLRASKEGIIHAIGYRPTKNPSAHRTPATLWRSDIFHLRAA